MGAYTEALEDSAAAAEAVAAPANDLPGGPAHLRATLADLGVTDEHLHPVRLVDRAAWVRLGR